MEIKPLITLVFSRTGRIHISNWKEWCWKDHSFRLLNGMIKPTAGRIIINNQDFTKLKGRKKRDIQKTIGTIYQDFCLVDTITCLDNVLNGALADRNAFQALFGIFTKEQKEYARKQLEAVGLSEKCIHMRENFREDRNRELQLQGH